MPDQCNQCERIKKKSQKEPPKNTNWGETISL